MADGLTVSSLGAKSSAERKGDDFNETQDGIDDTAADDDDGANGDDGEFANFFFLFLSGEFRRIRHSGQAANDRANSIRVALRL